MKINVEITARENGRVVNVLRGHNVWVPTGKEYLAKAASFTSPNLSTTEGTVDLVSDFPTLTNETLHFRIGDVSGWLDYVVVLSSPVDATQLLAQINSQISGGVASLGGSSGLVLTSSAPTSIEIVAGSVLPRLGLAPHVTSASGMTTTPLDTRRIKHMGLGIGGLNQMVGIVSLPPISTSYPPGADPNATAGNEYNKGYPSSPPISSLEMPVRISGGEDPYPGDPADVWLIQYPKFSSYIVAPGSIRFRGEILSADNDILYGSFVQMPLSEAGLFLSDADVNDAYNPGKMVAYYSFDTILLLLPGIDLEIVWTVSF